MDPYFVTFVAVTLNDYILKNINNMNTLKYASC
jgi:hypothetical protein